MSTTNAAEQTRRYIAVDMGAESSRIMLGTLAGNTIEIEELHRFDSRNTVVQGTRYWDILYLFSEIKAGLRAYVQRYGSHVDGIGVDSWGVDFGLIDAEGTMLQNPVHYRDHRTDGILERAFEVVPAETIYSRTGIQFMVFNTLYQLWALNRAAPNLLQAAGGFLNTPNLLSCFMTGRACCEYTMASTTQMLDVYKRDWARDLIEAFGIPLSVLPEIVPPGTKLGKLETAFAEEIGMAPCDVIAPCTHDTASAVAATPAQGPDWAFLSSGTWSLFGMELDSPRTEGKAHEYNFTNEGGYNNTIRLLKNIMGLWIVQQSRAAWDRRGESYTYAELTDLAAQAEPFQTLIDVDDPAFLNPHDMLEAIAGHCRATGQAVPATVGATVRAVLEGLALRYAIVIEQLEEITGTVIERIHAIGGGIQNRLLCQFTADATGRPVIAGPVEATAMGNIIVQAIAKGDIPDWAAARSIVAQSVHLETYTPTDTTAWREQVKRIPR